uniref:P-type H(+)-exporting transporter n=1 Tax=Spumella elongata TaxID=89044 RepID=A0A7S3HPG4_9STRA
MGPKELSHDGPIVPRLAAIEDMAGMSILCSDKTGTLTMNKMVIQEETPVYKKGESQYSLLRYAAMAAKWWEPPRDALDTLTLNAVDMPSMSAVEQLAFLPFDPIVKRTEGTVKEISTGKIYKTTKGAPHVILKLVTSTNQNQKANEAITAAVEEDVHSFGLRGIRTLAVAKTNDKDQWEFLGMLTFLDPPRPDTKQTIEDSNKYGVAVKMITGDHLLIARETARVLGMGEYVKNAAQLPHLDPVTKKKPDLLARDYGNMCLATDTFAQVLPEQKYLIVECLRELGYKVGMTGDGVNDAPALKRADVGIAVAGATDAARAAADIVLTQPGLSTVVEGVLISRRIFVRISNFLTYRIAATLQLLVFFFIAILAFKPVEYMPSGWETIPEFYDSKEWPEFFKMPVLMLMLITLLNDGTLIAIGYDNAKARDTPEKWNLRVMFVVSSMLAAVSCVSSLLLLKVSLQSWQHGNFLRQFEVGRLSYGQITTAIYLKVSISDFLTLFSARTGPDWFFSIAPEWSLIGAAAVALLVSTILALTWPESTMDDVPIQGLAQGKPYDFIMYIWVYCVAWFFVQDAVKVLTYYLLKTFNVFGFNDTGKLVLPDSALRYIRDNKAKDLHSINASGSRR